MIDEILTEYAMLQVLGGLEKSLITPLESDYHRQVEAARNEILKRCGE